MFVVSLLMVLLVIAAIVGVVLLIVGLTNPFKRRKLIVVGSTMLAVCATLMLFLMLFSSAF